eukprot:TRINITY_DN11087_c0_g1_i1.p1 TRINITY_DN11087_c0_g1~~TRINITY_DN11087_c0_g1_i1.p1  ORF type:complete len:427 (-),score=107.36 TRINITY_DN11087_c0_g1_i1:222-1502(-)
MDSVLFSCDCNRFFPLDHEYYCIDCQKLNCTFCVTREIDWYYCPSCLENVTSADAFMQKSSCKKCFECPVCFATLQYQLQAGETEEKKTCFLTCGFCQWNSLGLQMVSDSVPGLIAKNLEREKSDPLQKDLSKLIQQLQREESDRDKSLPHRLSARFRRPGPVSAGDVRATAVLQAKTFTVRDLDEYMVSKEAALVAKRERLPEPEPTDQTLEEIRTAVDLAKVSTLEQRLQQPASQSRNIGELYPRRRQLLVRCSKRCVRCDKLLIKPKLSPTKTDFERLHIALTFIPRITIMAVPTLVVGQESELRLKLRNPVDKLVEVRLVALDDPESTASIKVPAETFLGAKTDDPDEDAGADYQARRAADDPASIVQRSANFVVLRTLITPRAASAIKATLKLTLKFSYMNLGEQQPSIVFKLKLPPAVLP